ncbi:helix-turn-helix domain-containing protein [Nonomuraea terrae]|nr:helix-turn-helix domain-containing protein [Nonomuraea terrae]
MPLTLRQAAAHLNLSYDALRKITAAGLLPAAGQSGGKVLIPTDVAQRIQARSAVALHRLLPTATGSTTMAVLRVDVAKPVPQEDRSFIGFHADLPSADLLEALRGWWMGRPEKIAQAGVLTVTLGGFVVAVLTGLSDWDTKLTDNGRVRHRFDARLAGYISDLDTSVNMITAGTADDLRIAELLLGKRLESLAGGPIAYVSAAAAPPAGL